MNEIGEKKLAIRDVGEILDQSESEEKVLQGRYLIAMNSLSEDHIPREISCRNQEKQEILRFVTEGLSKQGMREALYISGLPGIGKTLCVKEVLKNIQEKEKAKGHEKKSKFIYLNAMRIKNPENIYKSFFFQLTNTKNIKAKYALDDLLKKGIGYPKIASLNKVVVIDEIDELFTKDQDILYNLFQWQHYSASKLILIAISNTINFPETLKQKILSRIGNKRLIFKQYKSHQIERIMKDRVGEVNIFDKGAVQYICKKMTACASDIRKCLHILRESIHQYVNSKQEKKPDGKVPFEMVVRAHEAQYAKAFREVYLYLPLSYKKVLSCLAIHFRYESYAISIRELFKMVRNYYGMGRQSLKEVLIGIKQLFIVNVYFSKKVSIQSMGKKMKHLEQEHISLTIGADQIMFAAYKDANDQIILGTYTGAN